MHHAFGPSYQKFTLGVSESIPVFWGGSNKIPPNGDKTSEMYCLTGLKVSSPKPRCQWDHRPSDTSRGRSSCASVSLREGHLVFLGL